MSTIKERIRKKVVEMAGDEKRKVMEQEATQRREQEQRAEVENDFKRNNRKGVSLVLEAMNSATLNEVLAEIESRMNKGKGLFKERIKLVKSFPDGSESYIKGWISFPRGSRLVNYNGLTFVYSEKTESVKIIASYSKSFRGEGLSDVHLSLSFDTLEDLIEALVSGIALSDKSSNSGMLFNAYDLANGGRNKY